MAKNHTDTRAGSSSSASSGTTDKSAGDDEEHTRLLSPVEQQTNGSPPVSEDGRFQPLLPRVRVLILNDTNHATKPQPVEGRRKEDGTSAPPTWHHHLSHFSPFHTLFACSLHVTQTPHQCKQTKTTTTITKEHVCKFSVRC